MSLHLSSEQISNWMTGERTAQAERHVRECAECGDELQRLENAFSLFRESGRHWSERCYRERPFDGAGAARNRPMPLWAGVLAAGVVLGAFLLERPSPAPQRREETFFQIPYVAPLAPYERTGVIRMDVPVAALITAGFEVHVADVGGTVKADILFGQDGRAHAIRLVPNSMKRQQGGISND